MARRAWSPHLSALTWLGHILAAWDSTRRIILANVAMAALSCNPSEQSQRATPVLHFIAASFWANPRPDGLLHLGAAYRGATDLTAHAILTERAVLSK